MFPTVLTLCFFLKILLRTRHFAPTFIESHYKTSAKTDRQSLEQGRPTFFDPRAILTHQKYWRAKQIKHPNFVPKSQ